MTSPYGTGMVSPFALSGNINIDALANIGIKWGSGGQGVGAVVTYSFPKAGAAWISDYYDSEPFDGFQGFNAAQQSAARQALTLWSDVANITFQEVPDTATDVGDIRFGFSRVVTNSTAAAWAYYPYDDPNYEFPEAGDIWLDAKYPPNLQMIPGKFGFSTLLHEIGHAIGLDHPFNDGFGDPSLPPGFDNLRYTVMSYTPVAFVSVEPMTPMLLDILAIQYIYGANMTTRTGDDVYKFSSSTQQLRAIWDAGGIDTIDAGNQTAAAIINLAAGEFSSIGRRVSGVAADNIAIAYGVTIENAKGGRGADKISGNDIANVLSGNAGNDTLDGELGADTLRGGRGNDIYIIGDSDTIDEQGNRDLGDEIRITTSVNLTTFAGGSIERATAVGDDAVNFTGNKAANILIGNAATNILDGASGADVLKGGGGNDLYYVDATTDRIDEGINKDSADEVRSTVAINLTTLGKGQIEIATLLGTKSVGVTGNTLNNIITGNSGANLLNGAGGNDTLKGGEGNDTLTDTLGSNLLGGGSGNDRLTTGAGNDTLDGGSGIDVMNGGAGSDTYFVDNDKDKVTDLGTVDLNDAVVASISLDLTQFAAGLIEHATLVGDGALNVIGNSKNNSIIGNDAANLLTGNLGNDTLDGGLGADTLLGGKGNDTYVVDETGDSVDEQGNVDASDRIRSFITIDLATFALGVIEHADLMGANAIKALGNSANNSLSGNEGDNSVDGREGDDTIAGNGGSDWLIGGTGNDQLDGGASNDTLIGQAGNDTLQGGTGADLMKGGAGNDIYYVDVDAPFFFDAIDEEANQDTADEIRASITVDLTQMGGGAIENAVAIEGSFAVVLIGNSSANLLVGNSNSNRLDGGGGNDTMRGGAGSDVYTIESLNDVVDEEGNKDTADEVRTSAVSLNLTAFAGGAIEDVRLSGSANLNITGNTAENSLFGNDGDNTIDGGAGNDFLLGAGGNDVLISGDGNDHIYGDTGNDLLIVQTITAGQILNGGGGFDEIRITGGGTTIDLRSISDSAFTWVESIDLTGSDNNQLTASAQDVMSLLTGGSSLFIKGNVGDSILFTDIVTSAGNVVIDGTDYASFNYGSATVYVEADVKALVTPPTALFLGNIEDSWGFRINSSSGLFGSMLAGVGDINQDGFEDVLISGGSTAYLLYGQSEKYDGPLSAANPVGANIAELTASSGSNATVSGVGDFNGDGVADLLIGNPDASFGGSASGGAYVVYGTSAGPIDQLALSGLDASGAMRFGGLPGQFASSYRGVGEAGDLNGDGYDDLLISTSGYTAGAFGAAYVTFGRADQPATIKAADLNGGNGFVFRDPGANLTMGETVSGRIDINGDGYDDLIVNEVTRTHVIFGHSGTFDADLLASELNGANGFTITGADLVVGSGGDFNGDGYDDLVLSDPSVAHGAFSGAGSVYVVYGKATGFGATFDLSQINGSNGFQVTGFKSFQEAGASACLTGDYNADGYDDLLIGAPGLALGTAGDGSAFVLYGHGGNNFASISLSQINGYNGIAITGASDSHETGDYVASSDIDGDGSDDMIIAATSDANAGTAFVVYGKTLNGLADTSYIQGDNIIDGGLGADAVNAGRGNDEIHVAGNKFFRIDGGTGVDTLHLDYAGAIDFANLDGNASTSDRNRIENVEVLDVDNGEANALTLHLADVLDLDATISDVGGVASLDNVLRIDGNAGDTLQMFNVDGWGAADTSSLTGYAVYSYEAVKVAVDLDIVVSMT